MTTQTFSLDELRGMVAICEEHGAVEVTPIDWRPDAPVTVLRLEPGGGVVAIDDAGAEVDIHTLEVDASSAGGDRPAAPADAHDSYPGGDAA